MNAITKNTTTAFDEAANESEAAKPPRMGDVKVESRRDRKLGFLIHDVSRMRRKAFDQFMKPLGVTRAQWWVLAYLSRQDGMMQTQLADILEVGKASLGTVIERLERNNLIERRLDPIDRRAKRIYLTRTAQHLLEKMTSFEHSFNEQLLRGLGPVERDQLVTLLSILKQSLLVMDMGDDAGKEKL